jgi:hypothetical protein
MRYFALPLVIFALLSMPALTERALAQSPVPNLVQNGNFATTALSPWTASGYAGTPLVERYDCAGQGADFCYGCSPGGQTGYAPFPPHAIQQSGILAVPVEHEFSIDIACQLSLLSVTAARPTVTVYLDQQQLAQHQFLPSNLNPKRRRLCARFVPNSAGLKTLRVEIDYQGLVQRQSPRVWVDNVQLRRATRPSFSMKGERRLGSKIEFWLQGTAGAPFVIFLAAGPAPTAIPLPGILGFLELDLFTMQPILSGAIGPRGEYSQSILIPKLSGIAGLPLHWQAAEFGSQGPSLGPSSLQAFYN